MKYLFTLSVLLSCLYAKTQTTGPIIDSMAQVILLPSYYSVNGVIFHQDYDPKLNSIRQRFTPTMAEVEMAEKTLMQQYNQANGTKVNAQKFFRRYVRQYFGYIDHNEHKRILLHLINTRKKRWFRKNIGNNYKYHYVYIFDDPNFQSQTFTVDLSDQTLHDY